MVNRRKTTTITVGVFALFLWATSPAQDAPLFATDILDNSIEAMGGFEAFASLRFSRLEYEQVGPPEQTPVPVQTVQSVMFPHTMVLNVDIHGEEAKHRLEGIETAGEDWLLEQYWREWWVVFARYAWHGLGEVWIEALEPVTEDDQNYYVIRIRPRDVNEYILYFDAGTWEPVKRVYSVDEVEMTDVFSDYQVHDGILFPMTVNSYREGELNETLNYRSVSFVFDVQPLAISTRFDDILTTSLEEKRIPGMVAMINRGDETIFHRAYGLESVELERPATVDSVFPLASVSKIVAGTVAMRLVEQGKLDLDASIAEYLDDVPDTHAGITPRHLLNHSHGLADALEDRRGPATPMSDEERGTAESRLAFAFSAPLKFEPGAGWAYSITGYEVLQTILEAISDSDYESLVYKEILSPMGMESARFGGSERIIPGRAGMDYAWDGDSLRYNYLDYDPAIYTAAGLNATARDVMTLYKGVISGGLLSEESRDEMWREVILENDEPTYYGLGWGSFRTTRDGRWSVGHSGGGSAWTRYFPDTDLTVIVLSNLNGAREDKLVYDLATAVEQDALLNPR